MNWLSEKIEVLVADELTTESGAPRVHDAVVVGSGYGGAVSALRLARAGVKTLVLERGREFLAGDFPNDLGDLGGQLRLQRNGQATISGYESALFEVRTGDGLSTLVGNALGGTSQINAGVVLEPDARVFAKQRSKGGEPAWPRALRSSPDGSMPQALKEAFATARESLQPQRFDRATTTQTGLKLGHQALAYPSCKTQRLYEMGEVIRSQADADVEVSVCAAEIEVNLKVDLPPRGPVAFKECNGCGDCVSGCNYGAKKTLTTSYLPLARQAGARMFTGVTVLSVRRADDVWIVRFVQTSARSLQRDGLQVPVHELHARHVVLSAGTLGSTEILLRSRNEHGLNLSGSLGERLSTNGDWVAFGYMLTQPVNGVGVGSGDPKRNFASGPTITSMVRIDHKHDVTQSVLIEDGAVPGAIANLFHEMVSTSATLAQLGEWGFRGQGEGNEPQSDWLTLHAKGLSHTQTLLSMAHDPSAGTMRMAQGSDGVELSYPSTALDSVVQRQEHYLGQISELGAIYLSNPALRPIPPNLSQLPSGPNIKGASVTVHPLGGCCMADDPALGVVNALGQVFDGGKDAQGQPSVHAGLYVLDGAIVPCSLGSNPLLTITALAEYAMANVASAIASTCQRIPAQQPAYILAPLPEPVFAGARNPHAGHAGITFSESMRAPRTSEGSWQFDWQGQPCPAHLILHMPVDDMSRFMADAQHVIRVKGARRGQPSTPEHLQAGLRLGGGPGCTVPPRTLWVESGSIRILPVPQVSRTQVLGAYLRTLWTWWTLRGYEEVARKVLQFLHLVKPDEGQSAGPITLLVALLKLCRHASESRTMVYELTLVDPQSGASRYTMEGRKEVGYAATWEDLLSHTLLRQPLQRPNLWTAFGRLQTTIRDEQGQIVSNGTLLMDLVDMTRLSAAQLQPQRDTPNALADLAAYPLWFTRLLIKTRLFDLPLPDYPEYIPQELTGTGRPPIPVPGVTEDPVTYWPSFSPLRIYWGRTDTALGPITKVQARPSEEIEVPRANHTDEKIVIKVTRYSQTDGGRSLQHGPTTDGLTQFKVMLMINGFAQSTLPFLPQELTRKPGSDDEPGMAEFFYELGYDIWLLDYRTSSTLEASKLPCTFDDIAQFDIPAAVRHVQAQLARESGIAEQKIQIYAYTHCVGAASLAMSMLGGYLQHPSGKNMLAGVTFGQMQAFPVGSPSAQTRLRVAGVLRDALGMEYLRLSAAERQPTAVESALDRLFTSLPVADGEECPDEHHRAWPKPYICTCKRICGVISPLLRHRMIKPLTHDRLAVYFGRANTSLLVHGERHVSYERLVNADGQNVYTTDTNMRNYLRLPIALLHGQHNQVFNVESAHRTLEQFSRVNPDLLASGRYRKIIAPDYGHFDCTIGFGPTMQEQILQPLKEFYAFAWTSNAEKVPTATLEQTGRPSGATRDSVKDSNEAQWLAQSYAKPPLAGPIVGWVRTSQREGRTVRCVRLWIEVDDMGSDPGFCVLTDCHRALHESQADLPPVQCWPVLRVPLQTHAGADLLQLPTLALSDHEPYIAICVADLEFDITDQSAPEPVTVRIFSMHPPSTLSTDKPAQSTPSSPTVSKADAQRFWQEMMQTIASNRMEALCANPQTLSRQRSALVVPTRLGVGVAQLSTAILLGPNEDTGLRFFVSCCRHPGIAFEELRTDQSLRTMRAVMEQDLPHPAFGLMVGDQIYADATAGLMDSPSPIDRVALRHRQAFATSGFANLTSVLPTYMVIDDHEIGDNWTRDHLKFQDKPSLEAHRRDAQRLFDTACASFAAYQWAHSPRKAPDAAPGFNYRFCEGGYDFFVLDTRTQRMRFSDPSQAVGEQQLHELTQWLSERPHARPKFIVSGSVIAPGQKQAVTHRDGLSDLMSDTWQMVQGQRMALLDYIAQNQIKNVVFISGDYHCSAVAEIEVGDAIKAYAIVTPPLYAPLPFANEDPKDVLPDEILHLPSGNVVKIRARASGGDGFTDVRLRESGPGTWLLQVRRHQLDRSAASPHDQVEEDAFVLS